MKYHITGMTAAFAIASGASAEAPKVVVDIAPVHSLVARVMQGVGEPDLLIRPEVSPHDYAMRPSEAKALQAAELVFWVGHGLTPQLEKTIDTVAHDAVSVEFLEAEGITLLSFRENAVFVLEEGDHEDSHLGHEDHHEGEDHDDHNEAAHDDHDEHASHKDTEHDDHGEHAGHDDHDHDHDHDGDDPHIWLSPDNARVITSVVADALSKADPENADHYAANAKEAQEELGLLIDEISATLAPVEAKSFVVFHDAYHYFEDRFGLKAAGAILVGDAVAPSASRLAELREVMAEKEVVCVFSEPQFNPKLVRTVAEGGQIKSVELDPIGVEQTLGVALYPEMLRALAGQISNCLKG